MLDQIFLALELVRKRDVMLTHLIQHPGCIIPLQVRDVDLLAQISQLLKLELRIGVLSVDGHHELDILPVLDQLAQRVQQWRLVHAFPDQLLSILYQQDCPLLT